MTAGQGVAFFNDSVFVITHNAITADCAYILIQFPAGQAGRSVILQNKTERWLGTHY